MCKIAAQKFIDAATEFLFHPRDRAKFIEAALAGYAETKVDDKILRPLIAAQCIQHKQILFAHPDFKPALSNCAELATDIAFAFAEQQISRPPLSIMCEQHQKSSMRYPFCCASCS